MKFRTIKLSVITLALACIALFALYSLKHPAGISSSIKNDVPVGYLDSFPVENNAVFEIKTAKVNAEPNKGTPSPSVAISAPINPLDDVIIKEKYNEWVRSRGYIDWLQDAYISYDHDLLKQLAIRDHDIKAMIVAGLQSFDIEEKKHWLELATIYGASAGMAALASNDIPKSIPEDGKKDFLANTMIARRVCELLNDYYTQSTKYESLYKLQYGITFSSDDKVLIEKQAHETYDRLEAQRIELGLGKFNNAIPPEVEAVYSYYETIGQIKRK